MIVLCGSKTLLDRLFASKLKCAFNFGANNALDPLSMPAVEGRANASLPLHA